MPAHVQTLFTYYHASHIFIIHDGRQRKRYKKSTIKIPPQKPPKKQPKVAFHMIATNNWGSQSHQHRLLTLGYLSRADWPAGKAGNEDCLLDEDDEPQLDELNPEADSEKEQGYHLSTDLSERRTVGKKYPCIHRSLKTRVFHRFCTHIMMGTLHKVFIQTQISVDHKQMLNS